MDGLVTGDITFGTGILLFLVAAITGAIGGAIGGILIGGKDIGNELAAIVGAFFGPVVTAPGTVVGLLLLSLL